MSEWVVEMAGRGDEMSNGKKSLRIEIHHDGDIVVCIDEDGIPIEDEHRNKASVEFCSTAGGGGRSPHTREALRVLVEAMKLDAKECPDGIPKYPIGLTE